VDHTAIYSDRFIPSRVGSTLAFASNLQQAEVVTNGGNNNNSNNSNVHSPTPNQTNTATAAGTAGSASGAGGGSVEGQVMLTTLVSVQQCSQGPWSLVQSL
jgi:hypothetical protein